MEVLMKAFFHQNQIITVDSEAYDVCRAIVRQRKKKRLEGIDVFLSLLRILMLAKSLKYIRYIFKKNRNNKWFCIIKNRLNPIFVAFCGIVTTTISLSKMIFKEEKQSKVEQIQVCEYDKETEAENNIFDSKIYRNRKLKSSAKLISSSLLRINHSQSTIMLKENK